MENFESIKRTNQDETFDIKEFVLKLYSFWWIFAITLLLALIISFVVNNMAIPVYSASTSVLVQQEQSMLDQKFAESMGSMYNNQYQLSNEIGILKSYLLAQRTIRNLNFTIGYYSKWNFSEKEIYTNCPFVILLDTAVCQPLYKPVAITIISPDEFIISANERNVSFYNFKKEALYPSLDEFKLNGRTKLFKKFSRKNISFTIIPRNGLNLSDYVGKTYYVRFFDEFSLISRFRNINVTDNKSSSILNISLEGTNIQMLVDYLNVLTNEYLKKGVEKKNQIAENTLQFIDSQLVDITDSLKYSEKNLQDFKVNNAILNIDFQAQQVYTKLESIQNQKAELLVKLKYYKYLKNYILDNNTINLEDLSAPSAFGVQDPAVNNLMTELVHLYDEKADMSVNAKENNPFLLSMDARIKSLKNSISANLDNLMHATELSIQDVDHRADEVSLRMNRLPETQRNLFGFERKFKLNDALYTYLLTKRSEVQISKASYLPNNEIIDQARITECVSISPQKRKNNMLAILLGLGIPICFFLIRDYFNDKILTNDDIESLTSLPILGHIVHSKEKSHAVVSDFPMSLSSESIRAIRTGFQFVANENEKHIVLITSSMMNEGKSFTCLNLAISFSMNKKKVLIINFDMRKPKMQEYIGIDSDMGLSSYLGGYVKVEDIILASRFENLDVILSGPIPPNPMELISSESTQKLLMELKGKYDYILLDTPPIGMVADALLLTRHSDVNIFVIKHGFTSRKIFSQVNQNIQKKGIPFNIILNDVQIGKKHMVYSHGYAYTYGYGYGYSYNSDGTRRKEKKSSKKKSENNLSV